MAANELMEKLDIFFDDEINTFLKDHGGGAEPVEVNGSELVIRMTGACRSCLSQNDTVSGLILKKVSAVFPFIKKVTVTDDVSDEVYAQALKLFSSYTNQKAAR